MKNDMDLAVANWLESNDVNKFNILLDGATYEGVGISGGSAVVIGSKAASAYKEGEDLKKSINDIDELARKLVSSPANFVTTVMGIAQNRSGWNPIQPDNVSNAESFKKYIDQIIKFPLMVITKTDLTNVKYAEKNYDSLINNITSIYTGIAESDKNAVKEGLTSLAKSCVSKVNEKQTKVLFTQSTMCINEEVTVSFYSSNVSMEKTHQSGKGAPSDEFSSEVIVNKVEIRFNRSALNETIAKKICGILFKSIEDWVTEGTTPPPDKTIKFCFGE